MLDIEQAANYNGTVTGFEFHSHKPYASTTYTDSDEVRIPLSQQDIITAPFDSYLYITGTLSGKKADGTPSDIAFTNFGIAHLFEDIRYELNGIEVCKTRNLGTTSTIKGLLSFRPEEENSLKNTSWVGVNTTLKTEKFSFNIPLKYLLGFFDDYKKIILNIKQELVLLRSANDKDAIITTNSETWSVKIDSITWRVPHITVSDDFKIKLLSLIEKDAIIHLPFRQYELHEYPVLPTTKRQSWSVKTSNQLEKPRFVVLAFQTARKNDIKKNASNFDHCNLNNVKLYLNSQYFPYDNIHGDNTLFYDMFARFQSSYYGKNARPLINLETFKSYAPLYVIDCSNHNDSVKTGPVDVRLEFESTDAFPANTTAYCLIIHDSHYA
jgi:hypothetical protein